MCARCREALERSDAGFDCPRGHGFWDDDTLTVDGTKIGELGTLIANQLHPGRCPTCRKFMQLRRWNGMTIEVCAKHGVWVGADDVDHYFASAGRSRNAR